MREKEQKERGEITQKGIEIETGRSVVSRRHRSIDGSFGFSRPRVLIQKGIGRGGRERAKGAPEWTRWGYIPPSLAYVQEGGKSLLDVFLSILFLLLSHFFPLVHNFVLVVSSHSIGWSSSFLVRSMQSLNHLVVCRELPPS